MGEAATATEGAAAADDNLKPNKTGAAPAEPKSDAMPEMEGVAVTQAKPSGKIKEVSAAKSEPAAPAADQLSRAKPSMKNTQSNDDSAELALKKHQTDAKPDLAKYRKKEVQPADSQPITGWDAFHDFLAGNARLTETALQNRITSALVIVQFTIDDKGQPTNFRYKKRFGYGLDQEAVRLVKEFNWIPGTNREVEVEVNFR